MNHCSLKMPIFSYSIAGLGLLYYFVSDFTGILSLPPLFRMLLLVFVCFCAYLGSVSLCKTAKNPQKIMKTTFWGFFVLYIWFLITLVCFDDYFSRVGFDRLSSWNAKAFADYLQTRLNLVPFKTIGLFVKAIFIESEITARQIITNLLGNLAAFAPFAFFLPLLFDKFKRFGWFLLVMIGIVTTVELMQFALLTGYCEVDDLILNVGGAAILYWILRIKMVKAVVDKLVKC